MTMLTCGTSSSARTRSATMLLTAWRWTRTTASALLNARRARQASIAVQTFGPDMLRDIGVAACEIDWVDWDGVRDRSARMRARDPRA